MNCRMGMCAVRSVGATASTGRRPKNVDSRNISDAIHQIIRGVESSGLFIGFRTLWFMLGGFFLVDFDDAGDLDARSLQGFLDIGGPGINNFHHKISFCGHYFPYPSKCGASC